MSIDSWVVNVGAAKRERSEALSHTVSSLQSPAEEGLAGPYPILLARFWGAEQAPSAPHCAGGSACHELSAGGSAGVPK